MARLEEAEKGEARVLSYSIMICLYDIYTAFFSRCGNKPFFFHQPAVNDSCIIFGRRNVFVYYQQNWQRQIAHTKSGKYILETKTKVINHPGGGDGGEGRNGRL